MSIYLEQFNFSLLKSFKQQKKLSGPNPRATGTTEVLYQKVEQRHQTAHGHYISGGE